MFDNCYNMDTPTINVKLVEEGGRLPVKFNEEDAGYDLFANEQTTIYKGCRALISTGIAINIPTGYYGRIAPRSGLAVRSGIDVGAGVVDSTYTGVIKVLLFNFGENPFEVKVGDRIAQLICEKIGHFIIIEVNQLCDNSNRGNKGFGSSGQ